MVIAYIIICVIVHIFLAYRIVVERQNNEDNIEIRINQLTLLRTFVIIAGIIFLVLGLTLGLIQYGTDFFYMIVEVFENNLINSAIDDYDITMGSYYGVYSEVETLCIDVGVTLTVCVIECGLIIKSIKSNEKMKFKI